MSPSATRALIRPFVPVVAAALLAGGSAIAQISPLDEAIPPLGEPGDFFGFELDMSGETLVVGAHSEWGGSTGVNGDEADNSVIFAGAGYVFGRSGDDWVQQAYLKASNTGERDSFGHDVAVSGNTVVVSALWEDSAAPGVDGDQLDNSAENSGAVYVFVRTGATWTQQAYLKASNPDAHDQFGHSVDISGNTIVVSARGESSAAQGVDGDPLDNSAASAGAAYVFVRNGTAWSQEAYLKGHNTGAHDGFGESVAISGDRIVVGASGEYGSSSGVDGPDNDDIINAGAAYVFVRTGATWAQEAYLKAGQPVFNGQLGGAVAIDGDTVVAGSLASSSGVEGLAYVYTRDGSGWSVQQQLSASNAEAGDRFGGSVSVSGHVIAVGARGEDSMAGGINGDQADNSGNWVGATYLFTRSGSAWTQQAYIKPASSDWYDEFGYDVALAGDRLAVSAPQSNGWFGWTALFDIDGVTPDPWSDEGCALAGVSGDPTLTGSGSLAGEGLATISLSNAAPSATAQLFLAYASTPTAFKGGTLKPVPFVPLPPATTTPMGDLPISFLVPPGLPSGSELWFQWGIQDVSAVQGVALSNALLGVTP